MNPWIKIWTRPEETIDNLKDSDWVEVRGLLPYLLFGINGAAERKISLLFDFESRIAGLILIVVFGIVGALLAKIVWINLIFYFGKIWRGQATKRNIDTVISLGLIPEAFNFIYLVFAVILNDGNLQDVETNGGVSIICLLLSFRIVLIGLSRVQKFSYGFALLNVFVPQLVLSVLYLTIRGL